MSVELNFAIYEKYYLQAKKDNLIWTLHSFAIRFGLIFESDPDFEDIDIYSLPLIKEHGTAI